MSHLISKLFLTISLCFFIGSCVKDSENTTPVAQNQDYSILENKSLFNLIRVENDYLFFKNEELFVETLKRLSNLSISEKKQFESNLGFQSLSSLVDEELFNYKKEASKSFKYISVDDKGFATPIMPLIQKSLLLNSKGLVRIGRFIEYYNNTRFVRIKNSDTSNLSSALSSKDGDYSDFFVSTIQTSTSNVKSKIANGSGTLIYEQSLGYYPSPICPVYYLFKVYYSWYTTGLAPTSSGDKFISYEVSANSGCGFVCVGAIYNIDQTFSTLNGYITVYSGTPLSIGDHFKSFNLRGLSYNGSGTFSLLSGSNIITNGSFQGVFNITANLSSVHGQVISVGGNNVNF